MVAKVADAAGTSGNETFTEPEGTGRTAEPTTTTKAAKKSTVMAGGGGVAIGHDVVVAKITVGGNETSTKIPERGTGTTTSADAAAGGKLGDIMVAKVAVASSTGSNETAAATEGNGTTADAAEAATSDVMTCDGRN